MPADFSTARDEMQAAFKTAWDAGTPTVTGGQVPQVYWDGIGKENGQPGSSPWAEIFIRHAGSGSPTLHNEIGKRRVTKFGIITVLIFAPLEDGHGLTLVEGLAEVAKTAYEGQYTSSGVWFRNVRIQEIGVDGPHYQANVVSEFQYDELV